MVLLKLYFLVQMMTSAIGCMASVAALAILVVIYTREPNGVAPSLPTTSTTTTKPTARPTTHQPEPVCVTNGTTIHQHHSTSTVVFSCHRDVDWSPTLVWKQVNENGTFLNTNVTGEKLFKLIPNSLTLFMGQWWWLSW